MILATRIVLLVFCAFFLLTAVGAKTEKRGYMNIAGAAITAILLLVSFRIV